MSKEIYNTYKNHKGQTLPKSPVVPNTPEIRDYLEKTYNWQWKNSVNLIKEDKPWLMVGISASQSGNIYPHFSTNNDTDLSHYDDSMIKIFTEEEPFKKYLTWAIHLPFYIVNKR